MRHIPTRGRSLRTPTQHDATSLLPPDAVPGLLIKKGCEATIGQRQGNRVKRKLAVPPARSFPSPLLPSGVGGKALPVTLPRSAPALHADRPSSGRTSASCLGGH